MARRRKAFHFDLDEGRLREVYPSDSPTAYKGAWGEIRAFMESQGFEHTQYSGYESKRGMSYFDAFDVMSSLRRAFPWFEKCVRVATVTEVGRRHDVLEYFRQEDALGSPEHGTDARDRTVSLQREAHDMRDASDELGKGGPGPPDHGIDR